MTLPLGISLGLHGLMVLALIFGLSSSRTFEASNPIPVELVIESGLIETDEELDGEIDSLEDAPTEELAALEQPQPQVEMQTEPEDQLEDNPFTEAVDEITLSDDVTLVDQPVQTAERIGEARPQDLAEDTPTLALTPQDEVAPAPMSLDGTDDAQENQVAASQIRATSGSDDGNPDVASTEADESTESPSAVESDAPLIGQAFDVGEEALPAPGLMANDNDDVMALLTEEATDTAEKAEQREAEENVTERNEPTSETDGTDDVNFEGSENEEAEKFVLPIKPKNKPRALVAQAREQLEQEAEAQRRAEEQRLADAKAAEDAQREEAERAHQEQREMAQQQAAEEEIIREEQERWDREETERLQAEALEQQRQDNEQLDSLLADLDLAAANPTSSATPQGATARSELTQSEIRSIADDIANAWYVPPGVTVQTAPTVRVQIELAPDGSVLGVTVLDQARYRADPIFRAAADSMTRSVWQASPYDIPQASYDTWRLMNLTFDLKDLL